MVFLPYPPISLMIGRRKLQELRSDAFRDGLIPYSRIESNVRFSKHLVQQWLEERSFQPRPVNGKGAKRQ